MRNPSLLKPLQNSLIKIPRLALILVVAALTLIVLYTLYTIAQAKRPLSEWQNMVGSLDSPILLYSNDFQTIASASFGEGIRLWSASDKRLLDTVGDWRPGTQMSFSADGSVLGWTNDRYAFFYDSVFGRMTNTPIVAASKIDAFSISPADHTIAATGGNSLQLWDRYLPEEPYLVEKFGSDTTVDKLAFSQDGNTLAASLSDGTTHLYRLTISKTSPEFQATPLYTLPVTFTSPERVTVLTFSPNDQALAIGTNKGAATVIRTQDNTIAATLSVPTEITALDISRGLSRLAIAHTIEGTHSGNSAQPLGQITIFDTINSVQIWSTTWASEASPGYIWNIKFRDDGKTIKDNIIAAAYSDGTVKTYNLP